MKKVLFFLIFVIVIILITFFFSCKNEKVTILYGEDFEYVKDISKKENKDFCIVLSRTDCPPCEKYINVLADKYKNVAYKAVFNIIDTSLTENQWYQQWICTGTIPTTCIFSSKGELKTIISGAAESAMLCIESALSGSTECSAYFFKKHFPSKNDPIPMLNNILSCKLKMDKGEDVRDEIKNSLGIYSYPYPIYLKCLNEIKQGRTEEATYWAEQFLMSFDNPYYNMIYLDLNRVIKSIINPEYNPEEDAILSVVNEVNLDNCIVNKPKNFNLTITNSGKMSLFIRHIGMSCSCLKLLSEQTMTLVSGESGKVEFEFTAETKGEVYREISFFSDAANSVETVKLYANVK